MSEKKSLKIVFAGGGTGGHIYPGIAVADATRSLLEEKGYQVQITWIGNEKGMDRGIVEKNLVSCGGSIDQFVGIPCGKLRRYLSWENITDLFRIVKGYFKSRKILRQIRPDVVFSKGGFVSVPPCRAAKKLHIPYFTHECDFTPGLATKLNSKGARNILVSYEETKKYLSADLASKCLVTGNPVRPVFYEDMGKAGKEFLGIPASEKKPVLLVLGGSLGARQVNNLVIENLQWLKERFVVVHQTGKAFADENQAVMSSGDDSYKPFAFIYSEMPSVIQAADVILSRSGANSLWECAVCGKPMVLVPLCGNGSRGDQVDNARYFEERGGAFVLVGEDATGEKLKECLEKTLDESVRKGLSDSCRQLCGGEMPAGRIASIILDCIEG